MTNLNFNSNELACITKLSMNKLNNANDRLCKLVDGLDYTLLSANIDDIIDEITTNLSVISKVAKSISGITDKSYDDTLGISNRVSEQIDESSYSTLPCAECSIKSTIF